jgi:DNA ligase (NAD+)
MAKQSLETAKKRYLELRTEYYENGNTSATDAEYDALEDRIREEDPNWKSLKTTGVKVGAKTSRVLEVPMPSLDKIKDDNPEAVDAWVRKFGKEGYVHISAKLDGSSLQATYLNGKFTSLATRGDGITGKDISHFIPYVQLPRTIQSSHRKLVLRLEAVMPKKVYQSRYADSFDSDRALASAVFNRQDVHPAMKHIDLVVLKVQHPVMDIASGNSYAASCGFKVVPGKVLDSSSCTAERLSSMLEKIRDRSPYILDGLVIHSTGRCLPTEDRPPYAKAFKVNDEKNAIETEIIDIVWKASSFGILVPKAIIKPIKFGGVTVKHAALHNPRWASDRGAGIGATVKVIRSGEIIPKIVEVTKPAKLTLPSKKTYGEYEWDKTRTTLVLTQADDSRDVQVQAIARFFSKLGLDQVAGGLAEKLVEAGFTKTEDLPTLTVHDFAELPGVKSSAKNMAAQMERIRSGEFDIIKLMAASGCFDRGLGETRLRTLYEVKPGAFDPLWSKKPHKELQEQVASVKGCGPAFAKLYVEGLPGFWSWQKKSRAGYCHPVKEKAIQGPLTGQTFCWTGYRSPEEETWVTENGGTIESFKATTTVLFYKEGGKASGKIEKAGGRAKTFAEFKRSARI